MTRLIRAVAFFCSVALSSSALSKPFAIEVDCAVPECSSQEGRTTLWPFRDPNFFVRCEPPKWHLMRRPCLSGTLFHFDRQECVDPSQWVEPCPAGPEMPQCPRIVCATAQDQRQLWPEEDPSFFLRCIPRPDGGMMVVRRECTEGFLFSYTLQQCVDAQYWEQDCTFDDVTTIGTPTPEGETDTSTTSPVDETTTTTPATTTTEEPTTTTAEPTTTTTVEPTTTTTEEPTTTTTEDPTTTTEDPVTPGPTTTTTEHSRGTCPTPLCSFQDPKLYPHTDWTKFYQCVLNASGQMEAVVRSCGANTYFHAGMQNCLHIWQWEDFCI